MPGKMLASCNLPGERRFEAVIYDLLSESTDAIVNASNGGLSHGGGVAAAIADAAGEALVEHGRRIVAAQGRVPVGGAVMTTAGHLPFKGVIHAVGPRQGDGAEEDKIVAALAAAFAIADQNGFRSISFPAISSGIFAVPAATCARAYVRAPRAYFADHPGSSLALIRLCLFEGPLTGEVVRRIVS